MYFLFIYLHKILFKNFFNSLKSITHTHYHINRQQTQKDTKKLTQANKQLYTYSYRHIHILFLYQGIIIQKTMYTE